MSLTVVKTEVHHLDHPTKTRRFTFRVEEGSNAVEIRRWDSGRVVSHYLLTREMARQRYLFLKRKHGYTSW